MSRVVISGLSLPVSVGINTSGTKRGVAPSSAISARSAQQQHLRGGVSKANSQAITPYRRMRDLTVQASSDPDAGDAPADGGSEPEQTTAQTIAKFFVDSYVKDGMTIGIGTGPTVSCIIEDIGKRLKEGTLKGIKCVTGGQVSRSECAFQGIEMAYLSDQPTVDVAVEEASMVDVETQSLPYLTWVGSPVLNKAMQPELATIRSMLKLAELKVVVTDSLSKVRDGRLIGEVPVMIDAGEEGQEWEEPAEELDDIFIGDADLWRRPQSLQDLDDSDPRGGKTPYISDQGNTIIDIRFYETVKMFGEEKDYEEIAKEIESVPGVVAHGLMVNETDILLVPGKDGDGIVKLSKTDKVLQKDDEGKTDDYL